eukprot:3337030-Pleurochrysis_carterae.AAC.1
MRTRLIWEKDYGALWTHLRNVHAHEHTRICRPKGRHGAGEKHFLPAEEGRCRARARAAVSLLAVRTPAKASAPANSPLRWRTVAQKSAAAGSGVPAGELTRASRRGASRTGTGTTTCRLRREGEGKLIGAQMHDHQRKGWQQARNYPFCNLRRKWCRGEHSKALAAEREGWTSLVLGQESRALRGKVKDNDEKARAAGVRASASADGGCGSFGDVHDHGWSRLGMAGSKHFRMWVEVPRLFTATEFDGIGLRDARASRSAREQI